jgi:hypothetical protein
MRRCPDRASGLQPRAPKHGTIRKTRGVVTLWRAKPPIMTDHRFRLLRGQPALNPAWDAPSRRHVAVTALFVTLLLVAQSLAWTAHATAHPASACPAAFPAQVGDDQTGAADSACTHLCPLCAALAMLGSAAVPRAIAGDLIAGYPPKAQPRRYVTALPAPTAWARPRAPPPLQPIAPIR